MERLDSVFSVISIWYVFVFHCCVVWRHQEVTSSSCILSPNPFPFTEDPFGQIAPPLIVFFDRSLESACWIRCINVPQPMRTYALIESCSVQTTPLYTRKHGMVGDLHAGRPACLAPHGIAGRDAKKES